MSPIHFYFGGNLTEQESNDIIDNRIKIYCTSKWCPMNTGMFIHPDQKNLLLKRPCLECNNKMREEFKVIDQRGNYETF